MALLLTIRSAKESRSSNYTIMVQEIHKRKFFLIMLICPDKMELAYISG